MKPRQTDPVFGLW